MSNVSDPLTHRTDIACQRGMLDNAFGRSIIETQDRFRVTAGAAERAKREKRETVGFEDWRVGISKCVESPSHEHDERVREQSRHRLRSVTESGRRRASLVRVLVIQVEHRASKRVISKQECRLGY